jgi:anaerobic ribonucleoside-triphosphate reductase activating protein
MQIKINSMDFNGSLVNGPGVRSLLFMQGCSRHCAECHNPSTWDMEQGVTYEIPQLVELMRDKCVNRKLTITGGEPLEQPKALEELLKELEGFDICLYTSYDLDEVPPSILRYLHYIKTGRYIASQRTTTSPYIGSKNQQFINLRG